MKIFRYHRYNKDRGAEVDTEVFKQIVRDEGYIIQDSGGINFNVFATAPLSTLVKGTTEF